MNLMNAVRESDLNVVHGLLLKAHISSCTFTYANQYGVVVIDPDLTVRVLGLVSKGLFRALLDVEIRPKLKSFRYFAVGLDTNTDDGRDRIVVLWHAQPMRWIYAINKIASVTRICNGELQINYRKRSLYFSESSLCSVENSSDVYRGVFTLTL